jgi:hypothetical protein
MIILWRRLEKKDGKRQRTVLCPDSGPGGKNERLFSGNLLQKIIL